MLFRFLTALVFVVAIAMAGVALEKGGLAYRRQISRQHYRLEALRDQHARLKLRTQKLGAPQRLLDSLEAGEIPLQPPEQPPVTALQHIPLLRLHPENSAKDSNADDSSLRAQSRRLANLPLPHTSSNH